MSGIAYPPQNHAAVESLCALGHDVHIVSWCFKKRAKEVMCALKAQPWFRQLASASTTEQRCGDGGKTHICLEKGLGALFDDSADICKEALEQGILVFPVCSQKENHQGFRKLGKKPYPSLADAVEAFLAMTYP